MKQKDLDKLTDESMTHIEPEVGQEYFLGVLLDGTSFHLADSREVNGIYIGLYEGKPTFLQGLGSWDIQMYSCDYVKGKVPIANHRCELGEWRIGINAKYACEVYQTEAENVLRTFLDNLVDYQSNKSKNRRGK